MLFVSHNMAAVYRLATSVMWLDHGRVMSIGGPRETIAKYLGGDRRSRYVAERRTDKPQLLQADICDTAGRPVSRLLNTDAVVVRLRYALPRRMSGAVVGIGVLAADGTQLFTTNTNDVSADVPQAAGEYEAAVTIPPDVLLVGEYHVATCLWDHAEIFDWQEPALSFAIEHGPSVLYAASADRKGFVHIPCTWAVREQAIEVEA